MLAATLAVPWHDVAGARFVVAGGVKILAAAALGVLASISALPVAGRRVVLVAAGALLLGAALADSHAAARLGDNGLALLATGAHELGAALWLGGLPCFWLALRPSGSAEFARRTGARFSLLAGSGVVLILAGAAVFVALYMGSLDAVYGTAYGAMAVTKGILLVLLLLLGLANFRGVRRIPEDGAVVAQIRRFVEVEMGIGVAVLMAAASITSMPPAVDLREDRVTLAEIGQRMAPALPRLRKSGARDARDSGTAGAP